MLRYIENSHMQHDTNSIIYKCKRMLKLYHNDVQCLIYLLDAYGNVNDHEFLKYYKEISRIARKNATNDIIDKIQLIALKYGLYDIVQSNIKVNDRRNTIQYYKLLIDIRDFAIRKKCKLLFYKNAKLHDIINKNAFDGYLLSKMSKDILRSDISDILQDCGILFFDIQCY